jgi:hypothetical protein
MATALALHKSKFYIPRVIRLLQLLNDKLPLVEKLKDQREDFVKFFQGHVADLPGWVWLFWLPQLTQILNEDKPITGEIAEKILIRVALNKVKRQEAPSIYTQAVYVALEPYSALPNAKRFLALKVRLEEAHEQPEVKCKSTLSTAVQPNPLKVIQLVGQELREKIACNVQQEVYDAVTTLFETVEPETLQKMTEQTIGQLDALFSSPRIADSQILSELKPFFVETFI